MGTWVSNAPGSGSSACQGPEQQLWNSKEAGEAAEGARGPQGHGHARLCGRDKDFGFCSE